MSGLILIRIVILVAVTIVMVDIIVIRGLPFSEGLKIFVVSLTQSSLVYSSMAYN